MSEIVDRVAGVHAPLPIESIARFCERWGIAQFGLFGSVLREDFRPESDIDVLVTFVKPDAVPDREAMRRELEALFGRKIDLVYRRVIERSDNYIRRKNILRSVKVIYDARRT